MLLIQVLMNHYRLFSYSCVLLPYLGEGGGFQVFKCTFCFVFLLIDIDINGKLTTQLYDKRDDFSFSIVNFPYLCSNIPSSPAYGVYVSQLIRYAGACSAYDQFLNRGKLLTDKLLLQGFQQSRLKAAFRKFYGRYNNLVYQYDLSLSQMLSVFHSHC